MRVGNLWWLAALSMTVIFFGFMALAIDVGLLFNAKRKLQNCADAAATSAAIDYMFNASQTTATAAATSAVSGNQMSNVSTTVNFNPNITSTYHNSSAYVEVILTQSDPTFFMGIFGKKNMTILARAVAGMPGGGNCLRYCFWIPTRRMRCNCRALLTSPQIIAALSSTRTHRMLCSLPELAAL